MTNYDNTQLGQYKLIEAIGHGGMATVYKAYQESLDRYVAVKVLLANSDPQFAARFKREARAVAALQHHNILPIYDYGEQNGLLYFVMQYVDTGITLHDMLGRPLAPIEALRLIGHVLHALDYAHARGVIHRDIKPANILLPSPNWALLADFGIAKLVNDSQHLTMTGFIIGTAAYMAPEQASGKPIDARTDLYSLGVVLYEMLTGRVPFDADTPMAMLTKHVYEPPPPPHVLNPNLSPLLETVLLRALEKDAHNRYQSAAEMADDLERAALHLARPRPSSEVTGLYQAGVEAFEQGRWDEAAERLTRLVALAPEYEDATLLLKAAQAAQVRATQQGRTAAPATTTEQKLKIVPTTEELADSDRELSIELGGAVTAPIATESRCPKCGLNIRAEWQSCPFCKAPLGQTAPSVAQTHTAASPGVSEPAPVAKPTWRRWAIIAGLVLLIGGGAGGGYAWSRRNASSASVPPPIVAAASAAPTSTSSPTLAPTSAPTQTPSDTATPQPSATSQPSATPQPTDTPRPPDAVITNSLQRLRGGPGQNYDNLGSYAQGAALTIVGKDETGEWLQVVVPDGQSGWMLATDLQINVPMADIAVAAAPPSPTPSATPKPKPTLIPAPRPIPPTPEPPTPEPPTPEPPTATPEPPTPEPPTPMPEPPTEKPKPPKPPPTPRRTPIP